MTEAYREDYYEDLQVSPRADNETIERVYRMLAKRYHPDNSKSGSVEKFDRITKAYHVLADPVRRAAYDASYEDVQARRWKPADAAAPSNLSGNRHDREIRNALLSILYVERRDAPLEASVGLYQLEKLLGWPEKVLEFHTWYLKEKGWIQRTDSGGYAITVDGIDALEQSGLTLGKDPLLPAPEPPGGYDAGECDPEVIDLKEIAGSDGPRKCFRTRAKPVGVLPARG